MIPSCSELAPFCESSRSLLLEDVAAVEMTFVVEVVMDRSLNGSEFLQGLDVPEPGHRPFPSSERLV
jgi:hypothetical protein